MLFEEPYLSEVSVLVLPTAIARVLKEHPEEIFGPIMKTRFTISFDPLLHRHIPSLCSRVPAGHVTVVVVVVCCRG
jgi:hypothetical protein